MTFRAAIAGGLAAAVLAFVPAIAQAQAGNGAPTGTRLRQAAEAMAIEDVRIIQREFARCIYDRRAQRSEALLNASDYMFVTQAAADDSDWIYSDARERCLGDAAFARIRGLRMHFDLPVLRNLLAEAAYLEATDEPLTITADDQEILTSRFFVDTPDTDQVRRIAGFADCVVYHEASWADALIRAVPGSDEEAAAIAVLAPMLGGCLQAGSDLRLDAATLRTMLADGLWARLQDQRRAREAVE